MQPPRFGQSALGLCSGLGWKVPPDEPNIVRPDKASSYILTVFSEPIFPVGILRPQVGACGPQSITVYVGQPIAIIPSHYLDLHLVTVGGGADYLCNPVNRGGASAVNFANPTRNFPVDFVRIVADCSLERFPCSAQMPDQSKHGRCVPGSGSPTSDKSRRKGHFQRSCPPAGAESNADCSRTRGNPCDWASESPEARTSRCCAFASD